MQEQRKPGLATMSAAARVSGIVRQLTSASSPRPGPGNKEAAHLFPIQTSLADQRNCAAGHVVADGNGYYDSQNLSVSLQVASGHSDAHRVETSRTEELE